MRHILTSFALLALLSACAGTPEVRGTASSKNPGETLPFGAIAEACEVKRRDFGSLIEKQGRWKLYDTRPGAVGPRNFYVTGFRDGCPRKVTGGVALFGDLSLYEMAHFGGGGAVPRAETDAAYAQIRGGACRGKGPCDEGGVKRLSRSTAFVSVYPAGGGGRSFELLMHDRKLVATAVK